MGEIWRNIPAYERYYQISTLGRIKGIDRTVRGKTIKGIIRKTVTIKGKEYVDLHKNNGRKRFLVWMLLCVTFSDSLIVPGCAILETSIRNHGFMPVNKKVVNMVATRSLEHI